MNFPGEWREPRDLGRGGSGGSVIIKAIFLSLGISSGLPPVEGCPRRPAEKAFPPPSRVSRPLNRGMGNFESCMSDRSERGGSSQIRGSSRIPPPGGRRYGEKGGRGATEFPPLPGSGSSLGYPTPRSELRLSKGENRVNSAELADKTYETCSAFPNAVKVIPQEREIKTDT